ncbi:MAG: 2,3-bisphosphoglycerate-independent phosphoglycerate mutase [Saprospiraceae bacterium]|nr:2,3-bisphosphoglycerate-independent phosphoglycerate mutase [Bacteroidia bacterium]NNE15145.1 2,3-bisphosphoglycerate-independent phosphoglycerate mutase [Saprospiraceae bacterium]NNL92976.1 2,3-bisphosphoglycerate-independent phosphoglycerate mutase [Saprospiraceae bacterium]
MTGKAFLIILDGWGKGLIPEVSAITQAKTPFIDSLYSKYPNANLVTFGSDVGLPQGQMGNSEVGHINIGAGRIVYQELARINKAVEDNTLKDNQAIIDMIAYAKSNNKPVHLMSLLSDGGVHSHIDHLISICQILSENNITVFIHAFLDGRDTAPTGGYEYLKKLTQNVDSSLVNLSSIIGRYYAMDRDNRWERIKKSYDLLVHGKGLITNDPLGAVKQYYDKDISDEFMEAIKVNSKEFGIIKEEDAVFFTNFRTDRPRQITEVLTQKDKPEFDMKKLNLHYVTMTEYDEKFKNIKVAFTKDKLENTLGEIIAKNELTQLRIAETEKYPHVTFFFSGGEEKPFEGEHRIMANSPKVATYDLAPEMSAYELTNEVHKYIINESPDLIIMNYANADMVGHTGDFNAAVKAAETLDACMESLIPIAKNADYNILIIADHGNSDIMINPDGTPHTAHTTNLVPIILIDPSNNYKHIKDGKLADIAPTILKLMKIDKPEEMTGNSLL